MCLSVHRFVCVSLSGANIEVAKFARENKVSETLAWIMKNLVLRVSYAVNRKIALVYRIHFLLKAHNCN